MATHCSSDDSTHPVLNTPQNPTLPGHLKHDYLWISSEGRAFPGAHHQLILHFLALDFARSKTLPLGLNSIGKRLRQHLPACLVSYGELKAIVKELVNFEPELIQTFDESQARHEKDADREIEGLLASPAPHLYAQAKTELAEDYARQQSFANKHGEETFTPANSNSFTDTMPIATTNGTTQVPATWQEPSVINGTCHKRSNTNHIDCGKPSLSRTHTSLWAILGQDRNLTETHILERDENSFVPSHPSPSSKNKSIMLSIDDDIKITPENARLYAPLYLASLTRLRYGETSIKSTLETEDHGIAPDKVEIINQHQQISPQEQKREGGELPGDLSAVLVNTLSQKGGAMIGYPVMPDIRRPDQTRYIKSHSNRLTIPASEAEPFIAWFSPLTDNVPEKIEGYAWYCARCYEPSVTNGRLGKAKGKFSSKTTAEKHHQQIHNEKWKPVLPERERETGMQSKHPCAKAADRSPKVYDDPETLDTTHSGQAKSDRRTFEGLRALDSPALMNLGEDYKYQPAKARRKLFRDELALREGDPNTTKAVQKEDGLVFEDLQEENKAPKEVSRTRKYGGKQSAWKASGTCHCTKRKVVFSEREDVQEYKLEEDDDGNSCGVDTSEWS